MTRYLRLPLRWVPLPLGQASARLEAILTKWQGTPYSLKFVSPGVGVHCTAFVCHVLDELYRRPFSGTPNVPHDISFHNRSGAQAGMRWFLRRFLADRVERDVEPGDVLVTGPREGGPGHAVIVGPRANTLWQSTSAGVHFTGMALPEAYQLHAVFRPRGKEDWC